MNIIEDFHTHTKFSHGIGSIEDNVQAALRKGLKTIAITDHGPSYERYGINIGDFLQIKEEIKYLKEKYEGRINILLGIEANIIDSSGNIDIDYSVLKDIDILLVGFHFDIVYEDYLKEIRSDMRRNTTLQSKIDKKLYLEIKEANTHSMIEAIKKYNIDIITHIGDRFPVDIIKVGEVAKNRNTFIEINNFHRFPTGKQIKELAEIKKLKFTIGSDAHRPIDVGNFKIAIRKLKESLINEDRIINKII
ncbi:MAG: PHP domain-containing protein [Vallitalea sp.]|jgi:putative hydrolase|nr:PHP domain-containing protein [Vallitalea sp.]